MIERMVEIGNFRGSERQSVRENQMGDLEKILFPPRKLPAGTLRKVLKASVLPLLFGGICLGMGGGMGAAFVCIGNPVHDHWLSRNADITSGTVRKVTINRSARINNKNPWTILYEFEASGRSWDGRSFTTQERTIRGLKAGSKVEVEYLAAKPAINRAKGTRASLFPAWVFLVPGLFVVVGGVVFLCGVGKVFRLSSLLVNGHVAVARVTAHKWKRYINMGRRHPLDVSYAFQDSRRMEWSGRTRAYFPPLGLKATTGSELKIVYDASNPILNFAYELYGIEFSGGE